MIMPLGRSFALPRSDDMSQSDAFALPNSGLNPFLFAEVGTEVNGSTLTVLSVLARLGQDPWDQARQWVALPKAAIIDRLAQCITQMPLPPQALRDARQTAARLILLLPSAATPFSQPQIGLPGLPKLPAWAPAALAAGVIAIAIGAALSMSHETASPVVPFTDQKTPALKPIPGIHD
jgi:hypothetical protein